MILILVIALSFAAAALLGRFVLPLLRRLKAAQTERLEGPASHKAKNGTPTMGGLIFLPVYIVFSGVIALKYRAVIPLIIATLSFGAIGFLDDYLKVIRHDNLGLRAWQKFTLQFVAAGVLLFYMAHYAQVTFDALVPFSALFSSDARSVYVGLGSLTIPFLLAVIVGTVNGSNFTDGLDGLLSWVSIPIGLFIAAASLRVNVPITLSAAAMVGSLLGFLVYNHHPAKVFMGDTGSLAIGGFVASSMLMMRLPLLILIVAFIYFAEVLSVIIQVVYFKATKGKRFFRMAPIHHHFELGGWDEVKVVRVFAAVTAALCMVALAVI